MVFTECPKHNIALLLGFGRAMQYPSKFQNICYVFLGYLARGMEDLLNNFGHEQYPSIWVNP
jgi:hypothetical protein